MKMGRDGIKLPLEAIYGEAVSVFQNCESVLLIEATLKW
jgi:hypothetical protein